MAYENRREFKFEGETYWAGPKADLSMFAGKDMDVSFWQDIFSGVSLSGANLSGLILYGLDLKETLLKGANLSGCRISNCDFSVGDAVNLSGAIFRDVNMHDCVLVGANLRNADFTGAVIVGTDFESAILNEAKFCGAVISGGSLTGCKARKTDFESARLWGVQCEEANLEGAIFRGADLTGTLLYECRLNGADFSHAILDLKFWDTVDEDAAEEATFTPEFEPLQSYGTMTGPLLKFLKSDTPRKAADFKKRYPAEFEKLKAFTGGRDFSDRVIEEIKEASQTPFNWYVRQGTYLKGLQRISELPNQVLDIGIDLQEEGLTDEEIELITSQSKIKEDVDPVAELSKDGIFNIGWVRYFADDEAKVVFVEEIQSGNNLVTGDKRRAYNAAQWQVEEKLRGTRPFISTLNKSRESSEDEENKKKAIIRSLVEERLAAARAVIAPYASRFFQDALGLIMTEAVENGYAVEVVSQFNKGRQMDAGFSAPEIYESLPRKMGFVSGPSKAMNKRLKMYMPKNPPQAWIEERNARLLSSRYENPRRRR
jgi:uncharacterized protein YjbI with pentapeptide repeats